jgi:hypothetical protein
MSQITESKIKIINLKLKNTFRKAVYRNFCLFVGYKSAAYKSNSYLLAKDTVQSNCQCSFALDGRRHCLWSSLFLCCNRPRICLGLGSSCVATLERLGGSSLNPPGTGREQVCCGAGQLLPLSGHLGAARQRAGVKRRGLPGGGGRAAGGGGSGVPLHHLPGLAASHPRQTRSYIYCILYGQGYICIYI